MMDYRLPRDDIKKETQCCASLLCVIPVVNYSFNTKSMHITAARMRTRNG